MKPKNNILIKTADLIMAALFLCAVPDAAFSQPANDNFANATVLTGISGKTTGSNTDATWEPSENGWGKSVWYSWTAPESDIFYFDTYGSDFDTDIAVYTGSAVESLTRIAESIFYARTGIRYHIAVDGWETGNIVLNWNKVIPRTAGKFEMELSGQAFISGKKIESSGCIIFAFGPGGVSDCRGKGNFIRFIGKWGYILTMVSDVDGEEITFRIADSGTGQIYDIGDKVVFKAGTSANKDLDKPLKADSVYPVLGETGKSLDVTVSGFGFDENTSVLMYPDIGNSKAIIGSADTPGSAWDIAVSGTTAYVADAYGGLQIIDISDPADPHIVASVATQGFAKSVAVSGDIAYVTDENGLQIIAVSDPANPEIIASVATPGWASGVAVSGTTVYVTDGNLQIISVNDPKNPEIIASLVIPNGADDVSVSGATAYVADGYGLNIVDVSDPKKPRIIGSVDTPGSAYGVAVSGATAYVADYENGLQIISVSNPEKPQIIGSIDTPGWASDVEVSGTSVYVADYAAGLQIISVSDPAKPQIIGSVDTPGRAVSVAVSGATAYIADWDKGLQIVSVSDPENPENISSVAIPGHAYEVAVSGKTAFVTNGDGLQIISVSDPAKPEIVSSVTMPEDVYDLAVSGTTVFVIFTKGLYQSALQIISANDPANPELIASLDIPGDVSEVSVSGTTVFAVSMTDFYQSSLQIISVNDPANPEIVASLDIPTSYVSEIAVSGMTAFVTSGWPDNRLWIIDLSSTAAPRIIGSIDIPLSASDVTVSGDTALVTAYDIGLFIMPVTRVSPVTVNSETSISLNLPDPQIPGNYSLSFSDKEKIFQFKGAVTFSDPENFQVQKEKKAVIIAGRRSAGDYLWKYTQMCTEYAYLALLMQGYTRERIYFLSPDSRDADGDGKLNDIDGDSLKAVLEKTVADRASDGTGELLIYMTDHGGPGTFSLNEKEILKAEELDKWLDDFQTETSAQVILVYDACYSGSFIPLLRPPEGKKRIVITGASGSEEASFNSGGVQSFSFQFWASVFLNARIYDAFVKGRDMMKTEQSPNLDADGDGVGWLPDEKDVPKSDKTAAGGFIIGRGRMAASAPPVIGTVSEEQTLGGETSAKLRVSDIVSLNPVSRVWAVITPPDIAYAPGDPVTDLPVAELADPDGDGIYEGGYKGFFREGAYGISFCAASQGVSERDALYAVPVRTSVIQTKGSQALKGDLDRNGETGLADLLISLKVASGEALNFWYDYAESGIDVNGDKRVGIHDAVYILREIAK